jgi:hypothetical protein
MPPIRLLVGAMAALALFPSAASAQAGEGDNYLQPIFLASSESPLKPSPAIVGYNVDTTNYTIETGPIWGPTQTEFTTCGNSAYGKSVWGALYTDRYGRLDVTAAGFDAVIGIASFRDPNAPTPSQGACVDRSGGRLESFPGNDLPTVKKNHWYAVQVGGAQQPDGTLAGGPLEVNVELLPPEAVAADAVLKWRQSSGGIKVTSVKVTGPTGSKVTVACIKRSCGKATIVDKLSATSSVVFKGRRIPNGARLQVIVQAEDQIGEILYWQVGKNVAGTKQLGCTEPNSTALRTFGSCDGK